MAYRCRHECSFSCLAWISELPVLMPACCLAVHRVVQYCSLFNLLLLFFGVSATFAAIAVSYDLRFPLRYFVMRRRAFSQSFRRSILSTTHELPRTAFHRRVGIAGDICARDVPACRKVARRCRDIAHDAFVLKGFVSFHTAFFTIFEFARHAANLALGLLSLSYESRYLLAVVSVLHYAGVCRRSSAIACSNAAGKGAETYHL